MDLRESISNQTQASLQLARHLVSTEAKDKNLVFSPLSIHVVLGLIAAGSKDQTLTELLNFLKSKSTGELNSLSSQLITLIFADGGPLGGPRLSFANGVWIDQSLSFKPSFKETADNVYKATSTGVEFQTKAVEVMGEVNLWAEKETSGLIKEILPPGSVDASTRLIFANAVYFKGAWSEKFDASNTKDHDFFLLDGSSVQVPFMSSKKKQYIRSFDGFKILGLSYQQGEDKRKFSMYFLLPDAKDGLPALVEKPRKFLRDWESCSPFAGGGITEMVDSHVGPDLYVSSIFHKSFIEVNEEGTEAAAASAGVIKLRALLVEDEFDFVADHPFLFIIREDMTGVVLFIGHVLNPLLG
ncbi:Serpin-ZX [Forsythia ovata]|uniref:Serpin-ZX n=1 Tax=Forsythia ovata TaxID=205694 RepID=A0ABD1U7I3_9LAMI